MKLGYLGPKGTFSEQAALLYAQKNGLDCEYVIFSNITKVIDSVCKGEIDEAVVPLENSIEGTVTSTIDTLIFDVQLYIKSELILKVNQNLMIKKDSKAENVTKVLSHMQGLAQCRKYLRKIGINDTSAVSSTAEAARIVAESDGTIAAIAPERAADVYGLEIIGRNIADDDTNSTRFIVVSNKESSLEAHKKTSIAFTLDNDQSSGQLYRVLDILNIYQLNMLKIESRPSKHGLGTYVFYIDFVAENDDDLRDAVKLLKRKVPFFKFLGSYLSID